MSSWEYRQKEVAINIALDNASNLAVRNISSPVVSGLNGKSWIEQHKYSDECLPRLPSANLTCQSQAGVDAVPQNVRVENP
jgi:hypothetical protein